ncbi:GNAT family N-acetyltransferase [Mobilicoccus caccae]|uniref:N-acetyltransferase domain-containing protein n=1 Tax=Mobilicoccus caccae TaxID=1859295 RepID=A0ABQ6IPC0_9MICO|nr:GNAT family N-acetyltransferase [Mobilicoccus caccae]GMA39291.1 hypothetical protein GCM10025883_13360 [Mobilicoccus caccae]
MSGVHVSLVAVQEDVLAKLVAVAVSDACADEVTAPMTPGEAWTAERVAWLEDYHRACRAGLDSPVGEATWAVIHEGAPVGAVRLKRTDEPSTLETGIWLAQNVRGQRLAEAALTLVLARARACGAASVRAETSATNTPARALLDRLGFVSAEPDRNGRVSARCDLDPAFPG